MAWFTDLIRLEPFGAMGRVAVFVRVDGNRGRTQFNGGTKCADRDLATVGDQDLCEHGRSSLVGTMPGTANHTARAGTVWRGM